MLLTTSPAFAHMDPDGRCARGAFQSVEGAVVGTASMVYNAAGATEYAAASIFAPDWAYQNLGGYAQNFANQVTGTAQFVNNVASTAAYGAISPFAPNVAYNNYGGNVQQFMGQSPALYGGNDNSLAYKIGYGTVSMATVFMGGEASEAGNFGRVGGVNYGALDSLGRPTGASATLTADMLGTGTRANQAIMPPGYITDADFARGHLIGRQLGGSGSEPGNLVTLYQNPANHPVMSGIEGQVRTAVQGGQTVNYSAVPIYQGQNLIPSGITIMGQGSGGFNTAVTILNRGH